MEQVAPGELSSRMRWLIGGACGLTVLIAALGMHALWESAEWVEDSYYGAAGWGTGRTAFWYKDALAIGVAAAIGLAWLPRFRVARLIRVAVLLPLVHLVAIAVAAQLWFVLDADVAAKIAELGCCDRYQPQVTLPSLSVIGIAFAGIVALAIVIKRRHGEWAHGTVMLSLAYLLLVGLWLPVLSRFSVNSHESPYWWREVAERRFDSDTFTALATVPPALFAIAFVVVAFRFPRLFDAQRARIRTAALSLLGIATMLAATLPDNGWLLYLESTYLVMMAVVLAVGSLALLTAVSWLGSFAAHRRLRKLSQHPGVIAAEETEPVARFEITSWLRGPRLAVRSFVVTTPHGDVPITGARVLAPVPTTTTTLEVGEHAEVLARGDRVVIAGGVAKAAGHPFRASDTGDIAMVASPTTRRYRFSDVALVVWRPAVAYLAILVAVAAPALTILLS